MINIDIGFNTNNAAFADEDFKSEFDRIIDDVANRIKTESWEGKIFDVNGNTVGSYLVTDDKEVDEFYDEDSEEEEGNLL